MAEKIGLAILGKVSEYSVEPIGRQFSYLFQLSGNVKTLQKELEKLKKLKSDVQFQVDVATDNVEYIFATVEKWLEDVGKAEGEAQTIIDDKARFPKGCLNGWFLNIKSRHALSRKAKKRTQDIIDLRKEGNFPKVAGGQRREPSTSLNPIPAPPVLLPDIIEDRAKIPAGCFNNWCFSLRAKKRTGDIIELKQEVLPTTGDIIKPQQEVLPDPCALIMGSTSTAFESRELMLKKIIESLKDEDINMIGICGMGGVGKTTMVDEVLKRVKEENMFDDFAKTVVSQTINITNIQKDIAEWLRLKLEESNLDLRASLLKQRLEGKKVLIIMDDVWEQFHLKTLGITLEGGQKKCKIIFTSRNRDQLWTEFGSTRHELSLDPLPDNESWNLFKGKVGDFPDETPEFELIARDIVKECGGLPLAVVVLGSALRGRHKRTWNDTRARLRTTEGVRLKGFESLRLSYDYLDNHEAKSVFLLCSLFEEDSHIYIESLVNMGMGLRLFKGINSVEAARNRVFALVEHLQSRCLVSKGEAFITIHDVVRDVSKSIASTEKHSLVLEHGDTLEISLDQTLSEHRTWISVISDRITEFPSQLQLSSLELLRCNNKGIQIPDRCFEGMVKLQVLDIICSIKIFYFSPVLKLPSSLQSLTSLHTLCLQYFKVEDFTAIKFLKSLEILRITDEYIEELPKEIGQLTKLRLLDMSDCRKLERIAPGIISHLTVLEELYLGILRINWVAEENEKGINAAHREFKSLSNLYILHIVIKDPIFLPLFNNLERYQIQIGDVEYKFFEDSQNYERTFSISGVALEKDFNFPLHSSDALMLKGESTENLVFQLLQEASQSIKCLWISDTNTPEYLADVTDCSKAPFLVSTLESLKLVSLNNLQQIINGPLVPGNFAKLKKLDVRDCNQLRNIFRLSNAVEVCECESMEEVICWEGREEEADIKLQFPKLNYLGIGGKSLVCFCKGAKEIEFHQLRNMLLEDIPAAECIISYSDERSLKSIFPPKVLFPKLDWMELNDMPNVKEIWCGQPQDESFCNLTQLDIEGCDSLEYVFSPYTARYLVNLSGLEIRNCRSLKEVVSAKEEVDGQEEYSSNILPKLESVWLRDLPALLRFCHIVKELEFPELFVVKVKKCPEFKTFAPGFVHTPKLESINHGEWLDEEEKQWKGNLNSTIQHIYEDRQLELAQELLPFGKLKKLHVSNCKQPRNICQLSTDVNFVHLEELDVEYSESTTDVISCEGREEANGKLQFPKLKDLVIGGESIVCFCNGATKIEFHRLKKMTLSSISAVECIISTSDENPMNFIFPPKVLFPKLIAMELTDMPNMKEIWYGQPQAGSFCNMTKLYIEKCDSLEYVFSPYTARYLVNLFILEICNCLSLKEVVSAKQEIDGQEEYSSSILPKLRYVKLDNLPSLERFCHIAKDLEFLELNRVKVKNCHEFKTFAPGFVHTPKLISVHEEWLEEEEKLCKDNLNNIIQHIYEDRQLELAQELLPFGKLKVLHVSNCKQPRNICQLSTDVHFLHLEKLHVEYSESTTDVISCEGREEANGKLQFHKLKDLVIGGESIVCFCKGAIEIEFHRLEEMTLSSIPAVECIISTSDENPMNPIFPPKVLFPRLNGVHLIDMPNVKEIWCGQPQAGSFCNLTTLVIEGCDSLEYVFSPYIARYLVNLSYLGIKNCRSLKEIVSPKEEINGQEEYSSSILPKLKEVWLRDLPALLRFCHIVKELEFPELDRVKVKNCPEFKTFAPGFVHTPKLESVNHGEWIDEEEKLWKGNLNNTIQHIYEDEQQRRRKQEEEKEGDNENEIKEIVY